MKNKNKRRLIIGLIAIMSYIILYLLFINSKANEADKTLYDTINNIFGLGINAMTIYFVFKTYKKQEEQIDIQKIEIDESKKELEFNRALDIINRKLEHTLHEFKRSNEFDKTLFGKYEYHCKWLITSYLKASDESSISIEVFLKDKLISIPHRQKACLEVFQFLSGQFFLYANILVTYNLKESDKHRIKEFIMLSISNDLTDIISIFHDWFLPEIQNFETYNQSPYLKDLNRHIKMCTSFARSEYELFIEEYKLVKG
ncbi:MAG: hypothetical protein K0R07_20 [Sedimentibacter sp.]|jgi:hypothetical protein|nr:hypothetical protein [Sedimentibacter sp.]